MPFDPISFALCVKYADDEWVELTGGGITELHKHRFIPVPSSFCLLYGNISDFQLTPHQDVAIKLWGDILPHDVEGVMISGRKKTVLTDAYGDFSFLAAQNSQLRIVIEDAEIDKIVTVPVSSSINVKDLILVD